MLQNNMNNMKFYYNTYMFNKKIIRNIYYESILVNQRLKPNIYLK
jgi:hypothetical protein